MDKAKYIIMRLAAIGVLIGLGIVLIFVRANKKYNIKNILLSTAGAIAFFIAGYLYARTYTSTVNEVPVVKEVIKDTCITYVKKCEITREDSIAIYREIRKSKSRQSFNTIDDEDLSMNTQVSEQPPNDTIYTTTFRKKYNWGLVRLGIKIDAVGGCPVNMENYEIYYELDTLLLKERYTVEKTIVLEPKVKERTITRYVSIPDRKTYLVAGGGLATIGGIVSPTINTGIRVGSTTSVAVHYATRTQDFALSISAPIWSFEKKPKSIDRTVKKRRRIPKMGKIRLFSIGELFKKKEKKD